MPTDVRETISNLEVISTHGGEFLGILDKSGEEPSITMGLDLQGASYKGMNWHKAFIDWIVSFEMDELETVQVAGASAYRVRQIPTEAKMTLDATVLMYERIKKYADRITFCRIFKEKTGHLG
jgi:hypothetical protein